MFNPRPSSGISHSFSKSSSKLDSLARVDSQNSTTLDQPSQNYQDSSFVASKFRTDFAGLPKRSDDALRDAKPKTTKSVLDFDGTFSATAAPEHFGPAKTQEATTDAVFEKNHLLRLMFSLERISKGGNAKLLSEPLRFRSVDIAATYNKDQDPFFDKNEKMKKMLYKQNPKRTFFDNQSRLLKGVRNLAIKGMYREEDVGHEGHDAEKAFEVFDMRKIGDSVRFKDTFAPGYKDSTKDFAAGLTMDLVRQLSREKLDLARSFASRDEATNDLTSQFSREVPTGTGKLARDGSNHDLNKLFSRDSSAPELRQFKPRDDCASEMTRHYSKEAPTTDLSRHLSKEHSSAELSRHLSRESNASELGRHLSREINREAFMDSFKNLQHSWDMEEQSKNKSMYLNNTLGQNNTLRRGYKEYANNDLLKDSFTQTSSFYKDKPTPEKTEEDQSFLERLLDKPFEAADNVETDVVKFTQSFAETPKKHWNEVNLQWQYMDPQGMVHGPFSSDQMYHWYVKNFFPQNLRMRFNTKMPWTPFKDLFSANSVPFKSLPAQLSSQATSATSSNMPAPPQVPTAMANKIKDGWSQTTNSNMLSSPNSTFSNSTTKPANTNLLAPSNLLTSGTSLLGPSGTTTSLLGSSAPTTSLLGSTSTSLLGGATSNTNLLAPGNLLGNNSLLNPTPVTSSLLGPSTSPSLLGPSTSANTTSLLGAGNASPGLLGPTSGAAGAAGLLNNRLDTLWNANQTTVHPISSMSNIHMGVSNMGMNAIPPTPPNPLNKHLAANHMQQNAGLKKQLNNLQPTSALNSQFPPVAMAKEYNSLSDFNALNKEFVGLGNDFAALGKDFGLGELSKQHSSGSLGTQFPPASAGMKKAPPSGVATAVSTAATSAARTTGERKWNAPQVEVSSLLEIMELEKKSAQERSLKSPPKPVQTGWNLSNVATNNLSESDDFPSLSTVATTTSNANTVSASTGKKFGKHITMPLETFIEKHQMTSPPQLTESFSSKLLGNKH